MNLAWLGRKYSHRRLMLSATCCYVVAQTLMLVLPDAVSSLWWLTLPIFIGRSGAGADVPLAERPYDHACPNAQQGHRHGYERYGAAA